jgi:glycosyltransferase involved in cell wall biosynthesis
MKILIVCASIEVSWGGPPHAALKLGEALAINGHEVKVIAREPQPGAPLVPTPLDTEFLSRSYLSKFWEGFGRKSRRRIRKLVEQSDIIHIHEIWHYLQYAAAKECQDAGVPYVISPHGALSPSAIQHKRLKKILMWPIIQRPILQNAAFLHASSDTETIEFTEQKLSTDAEVWSNGIVVPEKQRDSDHQMIEKEFPQLKDKLVILFLGRIHPIKQLEILCHAYRSLINEAKYSDLHLVIAGPDESGLRPEFEKILTGKDHSSAFTFTGQLGVSEAKAIMHRADIYAQTSKSEGSSLAVLEAAATGTPMVITRGCHFEQAEEFGLGTIVDHNSKSVAIGLSKTIDDIKNGITIDSDSLERFRAEYSWDAIAAKIEKLYLSKL